jgi:hypothetical protein
MLFCRWVFSALIQTTRALRLRRNLVKLSVYKVSIKKISFSSVVQPEPDPQQP